SRRAGEPGHSPGDQLAGHGAGAGGEHALRREYLAVPELDRLPGPGWITQPAAALLVAVDRRAILHRPAAAAARPGEAARPGRGRAGRPRHRRDRVCRLRLRSRHGLPGRRRPAADDGDRAGHPGRLDDLVRALAVAARHDALSVSGQYFLLTLSVALAGHPVL